MTVEELINRLQQIEDKNKVVVCYDNKDDSFVGIRFVKEHELEAELI